MNKKLKIAILVILILLIIVGSLYFFGDFTFSTTEALNPHTVSGGGSVVP